ncbi:alpha/beta fold hydrolase [Sphingomonas alpina]|uniref:Alpha/beta hydrolase n=1 Tax=Sphingomonas alpina TaxID=653931 RepID=A0A7H0LLL8_9SPHN|nr:alpha/beta hydrolase [Sphingomonas alpina]QNQ10571.1 alpha/beta hydrolase [Sphingomonas alpina]
MNRLLAGGLLLVASALAAPALAQTAKPTVVLVHGAFADSSSWNGVIAVLERDGYSVVAAPNPLRGVRADADVVSDLVKSIKGPVVLVGHSYGGSVISEAAEGASNVRALVYVAAFAPDTGETALGLTGKFPGSTLAPTLAPPVRLTNGGNDLYILQARFHDQFAADLPLAEARLMAAGQRPVAEAALGEASTAPAWKHIPSWFVYGDKDRNIPPVALKFMADRAQSRGTLVVKGASHVVMVSNAAAVAGLIEKAAAAAR